MYKFTTGDILTSDADCLINTVNCEGYMGKGIAYQFKKKYPENYMSYKKACNEKSLTIGALHVFCEKGKLIINFPTKNKWREKSKVEHIHSGLEQLSLYFKSHQVRSVAIPPLGCGNGGLQWSEVKPIIIEYLDEFSETVDITIYEPSNYINTKATQAPQINASHLVLMLFKQKLKKFNKLRLQKAALFFNVFSQQEYFKFTAHKYGPYAHSIDILIKEIREYQEYYNLKTGDALSLAKNTLISGSIENKLKIFSKPMSKAANLINSLESDKDLELIATLTHLIDKNDDVTEERLLELVKLWTKEKVERFTDEEVLNTLRIMLEKAVIQKNLIGNIEIHTASVMESN